MRKRVFIIGLLLLVAFSAKSQLYSFGIKGGAGYSMYNLSNGYVFYQPEGSSISYHAGVFARRNLGKFFVQVDVLVASGMRATMSFRGNDISFSKSALNIPFTFGRSFYPGNIRLYAGVSPALYFGNAEIEYFLTNNKLLIQGNSGASQSIGYIGGLSYDLSKFTIDLRYEGTFLGGFFYENKIPNITTYHRFTSILLSLGYKIQ